MIKICNLYPIYKIWIQYKELFRAAVIPRTVPQTLHCLKEIIFMKFFKLEELYDSCFLLSCIFLTCKSQLYLIMSVIELHEMVSPENTSKISPKPMRFDLWNTQKWIDHIFFLPLKQFYTQANYCYNQKPRPVRQYFCQ